MRGKDNTLGVPALHRRASPAVRGEGEGRVFVFPGPTRKSGGEVEVGVSVSARALFVCEVANGWRAWSSPAPGG